MNIIPYTIIILLSVDILATIYKYTSRYTIYAIMIILKFKYSNIHHLVITTSTHFLISYYTYVLVPG